MKRLKLLLITFLALPVAVNANNFPADPLIKDLLNTADYKFDNGKDGCFQVRLAVPVATMPDIYGESSYSLKAEVESYAESCGLRF